LSLAEVNFTDFSLEALHTPPTITEFASRATTSAGEIPLNLAIINPPSGSPTIHWGQNISGDFDASFFAVLFVCLFAFLWFFSNRRHEKFLLSSLSDYQSQLEAVKAVVTELHRSLEHAQASASREASRLGELAAAAAARVEALEQERVGLWQRVDETRHHLADKEMELDKVSREARASVDHYNALLVNAAAKEELLLTRNKEAEEVSRILRAENERLRGENSALLASERVARALNASSEESRNGALKEVADLEAKLAAFTLQLEQPRAESQEAQMTNESSGDLVDAETSVEAKTNESPSELVSGQVVDLKVQDLARFGWDHYGGHHRDQAAPLPPLEAAEAIDQQDSFESLLTYNVFGFKSARVHMDPSMKPPRNRVPSTVKNTRKREWKAKMAAATEETEQEEEKRDE
jgi:hypothetical protein